MTSGRKNASDASGVGRRVGRDADAVTSHELGQFAHAHASVGGHGRVLPPEVLPWRTQCKIQMFLVWCVYAKYLPNMRWRGDPLHRVRTETCPATRCCCPETSPRTSASHLPHAPASRADAIVKPPATPARVFPVGPWRCASSRRSTPSWWESLSQHRVRSRCWSRLLTHLRQEQTIVLHK